MRLAIMMDKRMEKQWESIGNWGSIQGCGVGGFKY